MLLNDGWMNERRRIYHVSWINNWTRSVEGFFFNFFYAILPRLMALSHSTKDLTGRGPHRHKPAKKKKERGKEKKITHTRVHTSRLTHIAYSPASDGRRRPQWTAASLDILPHQCRHWPLLRHEGNTRCKRLATVASTPADVKSYVTCPRAWGAAGAACGSRGRLNSDDLKTGEAIRHDCCAGRRQADEKKLWREGDEVSC